MFGNYLKMHKTYIFFSPKIFFFDFETFPEIPRNIVLFTGPTLSICWIVSALLDSMDGPLARSVDLLKLCREVHDIVSQVDRDHD